METYRLPAWIKMALIVMLLTSSGCASFIQNVGVKLYYHPAELAASQIKKDIAYWNGSDADDAKQRLDLFLPQGKKWPTYVFVHGGSWTSGDKSLRVAGADVYGNIGRYFADRGIGVAVISYRLMPQVKWRDQIRDIARALVWVHRNIGAYGGDPRDLFLSGHSAGAQLAARVAFDPAFLKPFGLSPDVLCGLIPISGAGYDLTDEEVLKYAEEEGIFKTLFQDGVPPKGWLRAVSPMRFVSGDAPHSLVIYGEKDPEPLQHESERLYEALRESGAKTQRVVIPHVSHEEMVLALSDPGSEAALALEIFMKSRDCGN